MIIFDYYRLFAKIGKSIPGVSHVGKKIASDEFVQAVGFLYDNSIIADDVIAGVIVTSMLIAIGILIALLRIITLLSAIILSFTIALIMFIFITNNLLLKYNQVISQIELVTPYILEEMGTILLTTGSMFEAIQYVARGHYDIISPTFLLIVEQTNLGVPPEQLLTNFAEKQPSITLRRGILTFIQLSKVRQNSLDIVIRDAHEILQRKYEKLSMQWESRMMVYVGILVFLPIIVIMGLSIRGLSGNPFLLLLPVFQFILSSLLSKALFPNTVILIGEN